MYELTVRRTFAAAHQLRGYSGKCEALHGHNYVVEAMVRAEKLDPVGLAVDFKQLKAALDQLLDKFDHAFLNDLPAFADRNPSAENIAALIYRELSPLLPAGTGLYLVKVWENEDCSASYYE